MTRKRFNKLNLNYCDIKYNNLLISKLINCFMISGKKYISQKIIYNVMSMIKQKYLINPLNVINKMFFNCSPIINIKSRKLGGIIINIPFKISKIKSIGIVIRWLKQFLKKNNNIHNITFLIFKEIINGYNNCGFLIHKKYELYKQAILNRAYSFIL